MSDWPDKYVHKVVDGWHFEDETGAIDERTFETKQEAIEALLEYAEKGNYDAA